MTLFTRKQQPCICPRGQTKGVRLYGVSMPGDPNGRLDTAPGCPEHDACHHWTSENRAKYVVGRSWASPRSPWCPIHESRDCPSPDAIRDTIVLQGRPAGSSRPEPRSSR